MLLAAGCGGGSGDAPSVYPVTGKVTQGGKPLENVQVNFVPSDDTGLPSSGTTNADGVYTLSRHTGDAGAKPGNYRIVLSDTAAAASQSNYSDTKGGPPKTAESRIPEKWQTAESSPQSVEVKAESNTIDIDLGSG
jgi:hypothetical protein